MNSVKELIEAIAAGDMVVIMDDEDREHEGDLVMAAAHATPQAINFMASYGRGLICVPMTLPRARQLDLGPMAPSQDRYGTAFTVSVDARVGITTGISAHDRALTARLLADPSMGRSQFALPGHMFPLVSRPNGVLERPGHTEAAVDLTRLAGCTPVGVICEIMNDDGTMARADDLVAFAAKHGLKFGTIGSLIAYRDEAERVVRCTGRARMPVRYAPDDFQISCYARSVDDKEHLALTYGEVAEAENLLVRVHSECLTGDVLHSARCDCGDQLEAALDQIVEEGRGALIYLRQEGRGIGLIKKIEAYRLQDEHGMDTVDANLNLGLEADMRNYDIAARILQDLRIRSVRLLTNNPEKVDGLRRSGIDVAERVPITPPSRDGNVFYLQTKKTRMGHLL